MSGIEASDIAIDTKNRELGTEIVSSYCNNIFQVVY